MKVTKEKAAQNKDSMVSAAARSYREKGVEGISIAELARSAGLTHGGFYGQFPGGKDQLIAEAVTKIFKSNIDCWKYAESLKSIVEFYLSEMHRDDRGNSCPIPSLASDVSRCGGSASASFTNGIQGLLNALMGHIHQPRRRHADEHTFYKTQARKAVRRSFTGRAGHTNWARASIREHQDKSVRVGQADARPRTSRTPSGRTKPARGLFLRRR